MADEGFKRKLAAILCADVIGYSRLMRDDEEATVRDIAAHRVLISGIIQQHHGRVVDSPGDNILAEFASVVDAVNGAIKIQAEIKRNNADTPADRRMEFRIGINLGDVIEEEERIYGDGVNIAARVEGLASAGGIAVSGTVYEHIKDKLSLGYHFLGEQDVKNIPEPVRVYRLLTEPEDAGKLIGVEKKASKKGWLWAAAAAVVVAVVGLGIWQFYLRPPPLEPASVEKMAFPLPEKPSIAVLPFDNLSGDQSQDYVADGISEGIISSLSKIPDMLVIARNSTFVYKGKAVKVNQVAEELGVKYVLEGSVQRSGENLRVTAQLVNALEGHHLWSEKYDRNTKDLFAVQDDITRNIVIALQVELTEGEQARVWHNTTDNLEAWGYATRGIALFQQYTKEKNAKARELFKQAVELDPNYAFAWNSLAWTYLLDFRYGWGDSRAESMKKGIDFVKKASALDDSQPEVHLFWNVAYLFQGHYEKAIAEGKQAIKLGPSNATSHILQSMALHFAGNFDESIFHANKAMRLSPYYPTWYLKYIAMSYCMSGEYEKALASLKKAIERAKAEGSQLVPPQIHLVHTYVGLGQIKEAKALADAVLTLDPNFSLKSWQKSLFYKNPEDLDRHLNALRKAGLPDNPPLTLPDKPSIAVLAFDNLSGDPEQEFFSDGISEEIINALSKTDKLFVIARNSSFTYKGKPVNVKQIARELGVRYVLEGSVRKSGDRVRVTSQLIDTTTGHHLWSERYDRDLKDIFTVQDEITMKIITALQVELTDGEQMRVWATRFKTLDVQLKAMEMLSLWQEGTHESVMRFGQMAQELIDKEPQLSVGYRTLGWYHWWLALTGKSPKENMKKALELAQKAISLDNFDGMSHGLLGSIYLRMRQHEKAIEVGKRAVELDPNGAHVHLFLGQTFHFTGRPDEAIVYLNKAVRLNPFPPYMYLNALGRCYLQKGEYEKALIEFKKAHQRAPKSGMCHILLAITYSLLGQEEGARASAAKAVEVFPFASIELFSKTMPYKNQADLKLQIDALRKAGFPEKS